MRRARHNPWQSRHITRISVMSKSARPTSTCKPTSRSSNAPSTASHPQPVTPAATGLPTASSPSSTVYERARDRRHTGALLLELDRSPTAHDRASGHQCERVRCSPDACSAGRSGIRDIPIWPSEQLIRVKPAGISGGRLRGESHGHAHSAVRAADRCQRKVRPASSLARTAIGTCAGCANHPDPAMRNRRIVRHVRRVLVEEQAVPIGSQAVRNLADDLSGSRRQPKELA